LVLYHSSGSARIRCERHCVFCDYSSLNIHCPVFRPLFIRNYLSVSNAPAEYTAVFMFNILTIFLFALVFVYEFFCALRRRVVAFRSGESQAMQLQPRWFSVYRCKTHHAWLMVGVLRHHVAQNQTLESSCWYSFVKSLYVKGLSPRMLVLLDELWRKYWHFFLSRFFFKIFFHPRKFSQKRMKQSRRANWRTSLKYLIPSVNCLLWNRRAEGKLWWRGSNRSGSGWRDWGKVIRYMRYLSKIDIFITRSVFGLHFLCPQLA
jgi:hypothetical protein